MVHVRLLSLTAEKNVGFALHYNLDSTGVAPLTATPSAPNPEFWVLQYKSGKGFVLADESGNEQERDID